MSEPFPASFGDAIMMPDSASGLAPRLAGRVRRRAADYNSDACSGGGGAVDVGCDRAGTARLGAVGHGHPPQVPGPCLVEHDHVAAQALTLGLATPWAAVRRARYVLSGMQVRALVPLDSFAADLTLGENALGEAATELLDINLGF